MGLGDSAVGGESGARGELSADVALELRGDLGGVGAGRAGDSALRAKP